MIVNEEKKSNPWSVDNFIQIDNNMQQLSLKTFFACTFMEMNFLDVSINSKQIRNCRPRAVEQFCVDA